MPRVEFIVPGSPNPGFLSQIAVLKTSILSRPWQRWSPSVRCILGGPADWPAMQRWLPQLADVDVEILSADRFRDAGYLAQAERRLAVGAAGVDVVVLLDADTLLIGSLEDVLDEVLRENAVAGVMAHYGFPVPGGNATVRDWAALARGLLTEPIRFDHRYSLTAHAAPAQARRSPFYVNAGMILIAGPVLGDLNSAYARLRPRVTPRLFAPYYAGQVALALAVEERRLNTLALPMRYNFPNDPRAEARLPEELGNVVLLHYLRTDRFDRQEIFTDAGRYAAFLDLPLLGSNLTFQNAVRALLGSSYPFR